MKTLPKIASFSVDHRYILPGIYISRLDGDITTYDLRHRAPNGGDYIDPLTAHSLEHMVATHIRAGKIGGSVIYYGPMGCATGFYLLVRNADHCAVFSALKEALRATLSGVEMFGCDERECGNFRLLDLTSAKREAALYLTILEGVGEQPSFEYNTGG